MKNSLTLGLILAVSLNLTAQAQKFPESPLDAKFVTSDIRNFWTAFDSIQLSDSNPFKGYIKKGSIGLQGFVPNRIIGADSLLSMVNKRKDQYEKNREIEPLIKEKEKELKPYFYALEFWYPDAVFPPVYFVVGRFNSGGTTSENGLIIGVEKLNGLESLKELVIHESIHFQQKWPEDGEMNLLEQSIQEGSADFIAEIVTGQHGNIEANRYGKNHKDLLCKEFVGIMNGDNFQDWLYGTTGKDDRPNDLGYWIGYEIVKAYYDLQQDKKLAIHNILNIKNFEDFLRESGYLKKYIR